MRFVFFFFFNFTFFEQALEQAMKVIGEQNLIQQKEDRRKEEEKKGKYDMTKTTQGEAMERAQSTVNPMTKSLNTQSMMEGGDDFNYIESLTENYRKKQGALFHFEEHNTLICRCTALTVMLSMFKTYGRYMLRPGGNLINSASQSK